MTKKQMLERMRETHFDLMQDWYIFYDMAHDENIVSIVRESAKVIASEHHAQAQAIADLAKEFFDVDLLDEWLNA